MASPAPEPSGEPTAERPPPRMLQLAAVKVGGTVSRSVATSLVTRHVARVAVAAEFSSAAAVMASAQAQLLAKSLAVVRLRLTDVRLQGLVTAVKDYAARNPNALTDVEKLTASGAASMAVKSSLMATLVAGALQQSFAVASYVAGRRSAEEVRVVALTAASQTVGSLTLGAGGAALGAVLFPGPGAVVGSLVGSLVGGFVAPVPASPDEDEVEADAQTGFGTDGAPQTRDDGDYVVVCLQSGEPPTCRFPPEADSMPSCASFIQRDHASDVAVDAAALPADENDILLVYQFADEQEEAPLDAVFDAC